MGMQPWIRAGAPKRAPDPGSRFRRVRRHGSASMSKLGRIITEAGGGVKPPNRAI